MSYPHFGASDDFEVWLDGFVNDVRVEVRRARRKFPPGTGNPTLAAMTEEAGELAKAMMDESKARVWEEAVQLAAMGARCAIEGDSTLDHVRKLRRADDYAHCPVCGKRRCVHTDSEGR